MPTWRELENDFNELVPKMQYTRLDVQWGVAGEYWRLAGGFNKNVEKRFIALSQIAGGKLAQVLPPGTNLCDEMRPDHDLSNHWYKGIWKISGNLEHGPICELKNDDGEFAGFIYTGTINSIAEASATFCIELAAKYPDPATEKATVDSEQSLMDIDKDVTWKDRIVEAINLKPGIFGFSIDLKKIFRCKKDK
jgi:hypothetical protein